MLKIIVATRSARRTAEWCAAFEPAFPEARFLPWSDDVDTVGADYAIVWHPPGAMFTRETGLKAVFNLGAGVDGMLKLPELPDALPVVRLEDAGMAEQMTEYVLHGLIRASREFSIYDTFQRAASWAELPPIRRKDWPVGVMGMGAIGAEVARAISALGYSVAGWSRRPQELPDIESYAGMEQLSSFLARTRVLVNLLPLTPLTENILNRETLGQLQPNGYLINVARGQHLVEEDLLELLDFGHMQGALLDVFRTEPLPVDHRFWGHPKITVTPHIAAMTLKHDTVDQIIEKIRALEQNRPVSGVVQRGAGY